MAAARQSPTAYSIQIPASAVSSDSPATCSWLSQSTASDGGARFAAAGAIAVSSNISSRSLPFDERADVFVNQCGLLVNDPVCSVRYPLDRQILNELVDTFQVSSQQ